MVYVIGWGGAHWPNDADHSVHRDGSLLRVFQQLEALFAHHRLRAFHSRRDLHSVQTIAGATKIEYIAV